MLPGSSIGQRLVLTSFGESHGKSIGAVLDGCPAGLEIDEKDIQKMLDLRRPGQNLISTQRKEGDAQPAPHVKLNVSDCSGGSNTFLCNPADTLCRI